MLCLSRREGERIRIGDDIEIVVRHITGNRCVIAIDAPRDVNIVRGELLVMNCEVVDGKRVVDCE